MASAKARLYSRKMGEQPTSSVDELSRVRAENLRLEHELAEARERLKHAFATPLAGHLISSFEHGKFIDVNQAYCDFVGFTREEVLAADPYQHWMATTFSEDLDLERRELHRVVAGELDRYTIQKRYVRKDGELRWGALSFSCARSARTRS